MNKLDPDIVNRYKKNLNFGDDNKEEICGEVCRKLIEDSPRSSTSYEVRNALSPFLKDKSATFIKKKLGVGFQNAKKLKYGNKLKLKKYKKSQTQIVVDKIENFYKRDDISRLDTSKNKITKKGQKRYMNFPVQVAYKLFLEEYPEIKVSSSRFHWLKPKHILITSKTPHIMSLCILSKY